MTSQQFADQLLAEHRAVMASLLMDNIKRPTLDQYEATLSQLREAMSWISPSEYSSPSSAASL